jgi:acetyl-CoA C-acetyltransferase
MDVGLFWTWPVVKNKSRSLRDVVCVEACRTPYGIFNGSLREFSAPELGALAIEEVLLCYYGCSS